MTPPKIPPAKKKCHNIQAWMTRSEARLVKQAARAASKTVAGFAREALIEAARPKVTPKP